MRKLISMILFGLLIITAPVLAKNDPKYINQKMILLFDDFNQPNSSLWDYHSANNGHYNYAIVDGRTILKVWDDSQHCGRNDVIITSKITLTSPFTIYFKVKMLVVRRGNPSFGIYGIDNKSHNYVFNTCSDRKYINCHDGTSWLFDLKSRPLVYDWTTYKIMILLDRAVMSDGNITIVSVPLKDSYRITISGGSCCYGCAYNDCNGSGQHVIGYDWILVTKYPLLENYSLVI